ncbi:hypothetical protein [Pseudomonas sp. fls2-241-R2A-110]|uniref:hypothetical protein n=1 Tax=Pseudomonas sp. fls2-241-R2A-110 TaxID=3040311 RepID=UPI002554DBEF|nr:hypothetical protein [Pseudomonas sp. fls2-241-R2A-110]
MTVSSIWKKEKSKRSRFALERGRCDRNWVFHKERAVAVFQGFSEIADRFSVLDKESGAKLCDKDAPIYRGYDYVVLSEDDRLTDRRTIFNNGTSIHIEHGREAGGVLTVHYTFGQALIQVFLRPPISNQSIIEKADILLWVGRNTDALTSEFYEQLITKYLIFCRVESNYESSTFVERFRVRWWRFMDVRNRWQLFDTHVNLLNRWEVPVAAAIMALAGFILALAKL